jgi:hypothetical protein
MLALVLEGTRMLGLDVHMDGALVLLHKRAMGALELTGLGANIFKSHGGTIDTGRGKFNFFGNRIFRCIATLRLFVCTHGMYKIRNC